MSTTCVNQQGRYLEVTVTNPATVTSGIPVRIGNVLGVAEAAEGEGGVSATTKTMVDFGQAAFDLSVTDSVGGGIAIGDSLFFHDGAPATITNDPSGGYFFGYALEAVGVGLTATINVLKPGACGSALGVGNVATANLADDAVTNAKLASITRGSVKVGGAANAPTDLDCKTAGQILVGDGTDIASVPVSGDAVLTSVGALTVNKMGVSAKGTVVPQAANAVLVAADLGKIHTNTGAGAGITLTLPAAAAADVPGKHIKVQVTVAQTVQLVPAAGDKIFLGGDGVADKYCQIAGVIGNFIDAYSDGTDWLVINYSGVATKQA